jgi:ribulose-5-phosphate 4-epimerase/fuculose-1-phosphate aldolase
VVREVAMQVAEQVVSPVEKEQQQRLAQRIVSAFSTLARSALLATTVGDMSVRMPDTDTILMAPPRPFVEELTLKDLLEVTMGGRIVGRRGRPGFSAQVHLAIYGQRPDVKAVVHSHAPMATVLGLCELRTPPVTVDAVPFADLPRVPSSIPPDRQWVEEVATHLAGGAPAALLLNHGIVTVGENLREAVRRTLALEETSRILVTCHLLQRVPPSLPPDAVEILRGLSF